MLFPTSSTNNVIPSPCHVRLQMPPIAYIFKTFPQLTYTFDYVVFLSINCVNCIITLFFSMHYCYYKLLKANFHSSARYWQVKRTCFRSLTFYTTSRNSLYHKTQATNITFVPYPYFTKGQYCLSYVVPNAPNFDKADNNFALTAFFSEYKCTNFGQTTSPENVYTSKGFSVDTTSSLYYSITESLSLYYKIPFNVSTFLFSVEDQWHWSSIPGLYVTHVLYRKGHRDTALMKLTQQTILETSYFICFLRTLTSNAKSIGQTVSFLSFTKYYATSFTYTSNRSWSNNLKHSYGPLNEAPLTLSYNFTDQAYSSKANISRAVLTKSS